MVARIALRWGAACWFLAVLVLWAAVPVPASAHEVRPAYLEIRERTAGHDDAEYTEYDVTFKQPLIDGRRLKLSPVLGPNCEEQGDALRQIRGTFVVETWQVHCTGKLTQVRIDGLAVTLTDVIMRIEAGQETRTALLRPSDPVFAVSDAPASAVYFGLGVEHILLGPDHLLFVAVLVLLLPGRKVIWAATAFTAAHSLTLALAVLGHVTLPSSPVEIMIAASIVLVALECVFFLQGKPTVISRHPWPIIFTIGLIHGLGFAGALADIGLPSGEEAQALILFNVGIEIGQLVFIAVLCGFLWCVARYFSQRMMLIRLSCAYGIGAIGAFWTLERIVA